MPHAPRYIWNTAKMLSSISDISWRMRHFSSISAISWSMRHFSSISAISSSMSHLAVFQIYRGAWVISAIYLKYC
jgi:hypothetical protein